jgi:antibiotic biosynthesis monooxygenase (ABM) superfamily enzyme
MSLVKIYKYKIKPHTEEIYLELQEQVQNIYREFGEIEFTYLKDKKDFLSLKK